MTMPRVPSTPPSGPALNGKSSEAGDGDLERHLGSLRAKAPAGLVDAVLRELRLPGGSYDPTREYVRVEAAYGDLYVVYGESGISHVFAAAIAGETPAEFEATYLAEVGERARPGTRPPAGLARALRTGDGRGLKFDYGTLTAFQRAVLEKALEIPYGEVRPYGWIAREIGHPKAVRAVGTALGNNPIPVLIPCHRVVRSDGMIGNYGLGGAPKKREYLTREGVDVERLEELASAGFQVVGSDTTHVFCHPTCRDARRITPRHLVRFKDAHAAEAAGYRPCLHCRPAPVAQPA
jgi:methylated-DNA-[protein]-cysteine S-methyltransferase